MVAENDRQKNVFIIFNCSGFLCLIICELYGIWMKQKEKTADVVQFIRQMLREDDTAEEICFVRDKLLSRIKKEWDDC